MVLKTLEYQGSNMCYNVASTLYKKQSGIPGGTILTANKNWQACTFCYAYTYRQGILRTLDQGLKLQIYIFPLVKL